MKFLRFCSLLASLAVHVAGLARAAGTSNPWPQWQGPNRDNISTETGLLKQWPQGGPPRLWEIHGIGGGFADVSIANNQIYTLGDLADGCYVIALDLSGKKLWQTKIGETGGGNGYPGPRAQPTVSGDTLIALGQYGDLVCLDSLTGKLRWHKSMTSDFGGKMMSDWGYAESPLIDEGHVICTPGGQSGTMIALDLSTGNPVWRTKGLTDSAAYCSAVIAQIGGKKQYVQLTDRSVFGVSAEDGQVLWKAKRIGKTAVIATPIVKDNEVFVTSSYDVGCNLFQVTPQDGKFTVKEIYASRNMKNHHGGCILLNGFVYGCNDAMLTCLDFQTGSVKWKNRSIGKSSLACAEGRLYVRAEGSGAVALIDATPDGYHLISQFDQPDRSDAMAWPHPIIANGRLYLRDQDVLLCYDIRQK